MIELMSAHRISTTLPVAAPSFGPAYYVAGYANASDSYILKTAVYNATSPVAMSVTFDGVNAGAEATLTTLTAGNATAYNNVGSDVVKKEVTALTAGSGGVFEFELADLSVSVLEVKA